MNPLGASATIPHEWGVSAAEPRRPFEPERRHPAPPDAFDRKAFFDGGIGLLIEQGNVDNARVLLGRRAASHPDDPTVYLDAIRAERTAAPEAGAWQAWLERGLRKGVDLADEARRLVPAPALQAFLVRSELSWKVLQRQPSARDARELLRLRLEGLLLSEPLRALEELDSTELALAAFREVALRALCCATLRACALLHAPRVAALLPRYALVDAEHAADTAADADADRVRVLLALAPAFCAVEQHTPWPKPLVRFVALSSVLSASATRALCVALDHDLRAQPREYLRCADALATHAPAMLDALQAAAEAFAPAPTTAPDAAGPDHELTCAHADAALDRALPALERALSPLPLRLAALGGRLLGPLGHALDHACYRRAARSLLAALIARDGVTIAQLKTRLRNEPRAALQRLVRPLQADRALSLVQAWACAASSRARVD